MFVDGKLVAANRTGGALPDNSGNAPLRIGSKSVNTKKGYLHGLVDNILILNTPENLPLNFTSTSQFGKNSKIIDIQSADETDFRKQGVPPLLSR